MTYRVKNALAALNRLTTRFRAVLGAMMALGLAGLLAFHNVSSGPLHNLNDIGGWSNRALFIVMAAAVQALVLLGCTLLHRGSFAHLALRQLILTAGFYILLLGINHKAYVYVNVLQPLIRVMDEGGLAAGIRMEHHLSAPMLLLVYLITRGPVYDMYLLKLFAIFCYMALGLLLTHAADKKGFGIRAEVLLALWMILPHGFMNAAFSAMPEIAVVTLLAASLLLLDSAHWLRQAAGCACFGAACALSGAALYALPLYAYMAYREKLKKEYLLLVPGVMIVCCVPVIASGMGAGDALCSLFGANFGLPQYASGAPGLMNLVPFAQVEQMPQYAPILRHFEELDTVTHEQLYYTQAHFEQMASGMILVSLALAMGAWALAERMKDKPALHRMLVVVLGVLIACPNMTCGAWLAADLLCLYALLAAPKLRLPACMVLLATACSSVYPMTEEVMLPMIYAFALCLLAWLALVGVIPAREEEAVHE